MINLAIQLLATQLNQHLRRAYDLSEDMVVVSNLLDMDGSISPNINNKLVIYLTNILEHEADVMGSKALQMKSEGHRNNAANIKEQIVTQLYTVHENNIKVSENNKFAVKNEGEADSELFAQEDTNFPELRGLSFSVSGDESEIHGMNKIEKKLEYTVEEIKQIHCGDFSTRVTGTKENVENENAPAGRSLYVDNLTWGIDPKNNEKRGNWGNHYAPVIVVDGGDRGTFETAVGVDHAWFGIYGQKRGQTFRLKTVISDIKLAVAKGLIDKNISEELLSAINIYIEEGSTEHQDKYLEQELKKIAAIVGQNPDIDKKFKEEKERKRQEQKELNDHWEFILTNNVQAILERFNDENPSTVKFYILPKMRDRALQAKDEKTQTKIEEWQKLIDSDQSGKQNEYSTTQKVGIAVGGTIGAITLGYAIYSLISWLKKS